MNTLRRLALVLAVTLPAACAAPPDLPPAQPYSPAALGSLRYKAVLAAGDGRLPVFDNAVEGVLDHLRQGGRTAGVTRLSAAPGIIAQSGVQSASLDHLLGAVSSLQPEAGQGCLVFVTSHGAANRGLSLSATGETLSPASLDRALARGYGNAPTAVVASGCFSGSFAQPPMARANRVILTAARADRTSFGCGAGFTHTVYDRCFLDSLDRGGTWRQAFEGIRTCVTAEERRQHAAPSLPQAWFGGAVAGLPLPSGPAPAAP